jgi:ribonuclease H2 subunit A
MEFKCKRLLTPETQIVSESKADDKYPVVSAASIIAKVTRDTLLENWHFEEKEKEFSREFGCGYPSDPLCKQWLSEEIDEAFGYP